MPAAGECAGSAAKSSRAGRTQPEESANAIARYGAPPRTGVTRMPARPDKEWNRLRSLLPKRALGYLDGNDRHENGSWATLLSIATYCVTAGLVYEEFKYLVLDSDFGGSTSLLAPGKREKQCLEAWGHAQDNWTEPVDKDGVRWLVFELGTRVSRACWSGRAGSSDRLVSEAILSICHERGTYSPVLSTRFLAERTGLAHSTVGRSLKRLCERGLIRYARLTDKWNRQYRLNLHWAPSAKGHNGTSSLLRSTCTSMSLQLSPDNSVYQSTPLHDAFVTKALGASAGRIWLTQNQPVTAAEAAVRYGVSAKTARRNLDSLVAVGLASKGAGRPAVYKMTEVSPARLDEIAAEYGALGWLENQRDRHSGNREAHELGKRLRSDAMRSGYQLAAGYKGAES